MSALSAYFVPDGERFVATESTRGPWSREHQHGGPPAALLVRAMERLAGEAALLARMTFDFLRPVPIAPLTVRVEVTRAGTQVRRLQGALSSAEGTVVLQASALALRTAPVLPESIDDGAAAPDPPESATTSRRCSGDAVSPSTSATRGRIHAITGPLPHVPRTRRVSTEV